MLTFKGDEEVNSNYTFMFSKCKDTTVVIEGKIKNVIIESCQGTTVVFDSVISSAEVINSKKVTVQAKVQMP